MSQPYGIALLGCGTVGAGVVHLLTEQSARLARRSGRPLELRYVVVRDAKKHRPVALPTHLVGDLAPALADLNVDVVVEVVGGTTWAKDAVLAALAAGKHIVTANKALLSRHGDEVFAAARQANRAIAFEASVGGGVPMIATITQSLAANQITRLSGILNGTCNYIMTKMVEDGVDYQAALADAQRLGYAEADPTLDVDGSDAAHKLAILCRLAFGATVHPDQIDRQGIQGLGTITPTTRLIAEASLRGDRVKARVGPVDLPADSPLARIRGADNALLIESDAAGTTFVAGAGAGMMPTASAVVADLIDMALGRAQLTFQTICHR